MPSRKKPLEASLLRAEWKKISKVTGSNVGFAAQSHFCLGKSTEPIRSPPYPQADVADVGIRACTILTVDIVSVTSQLFVFPCIPPHKHKPKPRYINQCSFQHGRPRVEAQVGGRQACARPPNTPSPVLEQPTDSHGHLPAGNIHESPSLYLSGLLFYRHHTGMTVLAVCGYCDVKYARTVDGMHLAPAEWFVCVSTESAQLLCTSVSSGPQKLLTIVTTEEKGPSSSTHRSFRAPVPVRPRDPSVSTSSGLSLIFGALVPPHTLPPRIRSPPCIKIFFPN